MRLRGWSSRVLAVGHAAMLTACVVNDVELVPALPGHAGGGSLSGSAGSGAGSAGRSATEGGTAGDGDGGAGDAPATGGVAGQLAFAGNATGGSGAPSGGTASAGFGGGGKGGNGPVSGGGAGGNVGFGGAGAGGKDVGGGGSGGSGPATDYPPNCPAPSGTHSANALNESCWKASATECSLGNAAGLVNPPSNALDGDPLTRYSSGAKMDVSQKFFFDVDMGKAVSINGVKAYTKYPADYPPQLEIDVSTNGTSWTPVACGDAVTAIDFSFPAVTARYVRLVQHGTAEAWWSIETLEVFRATAADTCAGPGGGACTSTGTADPTTCCGVGHKL